MSIPISVVNVDQADAIRFSILDEALGKLGPDPVEFRAQDELKAAINRKAREDGFRNSSEAMRFVLAKWAFGEEHVQILITKRLASYGVTAHGIGGNPVQASAGTSN